jgi:hypothetical protein
LRSAAYLPELIALLQATRARLDHELSEASNLSLRDERAS